MQILRLIIIKFQNQFIEDNTDPYLADKLTIEEEMKGLFRILINRLRRVLKFGISYSKSIEEIYDLYIPDLEPNSLWKLIGTKVENSPDSIVSKKDMYDAYRKYCQQEK
jgi:phage/plasmid-associated DNA primase